MTIDKQALREKFEAWAEEAGALPWGHLKKQRTASGNYSIQIYTYMWQAWNACHEALLDELEASQSENERLAKALTERNGEPVEGLVKRVAELEEIATDYGMKFQRAQDALKHQSLLHKSQLEAAEKRIAEQREYYEGVIADGSKRIAELEIARDKCFLSGLKTGWQYGIADDTEGYNREIADAQAVIDRAAGINMEAE